MTRSHRDLGPKPAPDELLSPRKRPAQERGKATVDILMQATLQVLASDGFDGVTTTRVAERAGVSVGTLYQYFGDRDTLLAGAGRYYMDALRAHLVAAAGQAQGMPERVRAVLSALIYFALEKPALSTELTRIVRTHEHGRAVYDAALAELADLIDESFIGSSDPSMRDPALRQHTVFVTAHAVGGVFEALSSAGFRGLDPESLITVLERMVLGALGWSPSRTPGAMNE